NINNAGEQQDPNPDGGLDVVHEGASEMYTRGIGKPTEKSQNNGPPSTEMPQFRRCWRWCLPADVHMSRVKPAVIGTPSKVLADSSI
ncbi:MAG: hypothetical protein RI986_148, partial [Planctomycetota bacterium]